MENKNPEKHWIVRFLDDEVWQRHVYCSVDQVIGKMIEEDFNPDNIISITINGL